MRKNKGITLIALVITMIILLILASISVAVLSGDNSILRKTGEAKGGADVSNEEDIINLATTTVMNNNAFGKVVPEELISELNNNYGDTLNAKKINEKKVMVSFNSGRQYFVDTDGKTTNNEVTEGLTVGSNVTYEPTGGTYVWEAQYASSDLATDGSKDVTYNSTSTGADRVTNWKVFKINEAEGEVQLIPASYSTKVRLQGAQGYNNGIQLLDAVSSALYSHAAKGITARSMDMGDLEPLFDQTKLQNQKNRWNHNSLDYLDENDQVKNPFSQSESYFPRIYEEEKLSVINGIKKTDGLDNNDPGSKLYSRTEASSLTNQTTSATANNGYFQASTNIQPFRNYYYWAHATDTSSNYKEHGSVYSTILANTCWIATRYAYASSGTTGGFNIRIIGLGNPGSLDCNTMLKTDGTVANGNRPFLPIVTVTTDLIIPDGDNFRVDL